MPLRVPLTLSLVLGLLCLKGGNPSFVVSFLDEPVRVLLDGPVAALRNVHKVDPLVRLPIALGSAHAAALVFQRVQLVLERRAAARHLPAGRRVVAGSLAVILLPGAPPVLANGLRTP